METSRVRSAGGIVLGDAGTVALIWSRNSQAWLFPKGKIEEGESEEAAAIREIAEETGLTDLEYLDDLGRFERPRVGTLDSGPEIKDVRMFLFAAPPRAELAPTKEIEQARWVPLSQVMDLLGAGEHADWFAADRAWFIKVFDRVREAIQRD